MYNDHYSKNKCAKGGHNYKGEPVGLLLRSVDAADLKARIAAGEHIFLKGKTKACVEPIMVDGKWVDTSEE